MEQALPLTGPLCSVLRWGVSLFLHPSVPSYSSASGRNPTISRARLVDNCDEVCRLLATPVLNHVVSSTVVFSKVLRNHWNVIRMGTRPAHDTSV